MGSLSRGSHYASHLSLDTENDEEGENKQIGGSRTSANKKNPSRSQSAPFNRGWKVDIHPYYIDRPQSAMPSNNRATDVYEKRFASQENCFIQSADTSINYQTSVTSSPFEAVLNLEDLRNATAGVDECSYNEELPEDKGFTSTPSEACEHKIAPEHSPPEFIKPLKLPQTKSNDSIDFAPRMDDPLLISNSKVYSELHQDLEFVPQNELNEEDFTDAPKSPLLLDRQSSNSPKLVEQGHSQSEAPYLASINPNESLEESGLGTEPDLTTVSPNISSSPKSSSGKPRTSFLLPPVYSTDSLKLANEMPQSKADTPPNILFLADETESKHNKDVPTKKSRKRSLEVPPASIPPEIVVGNSNPSDLTHPENVVILTEEVCSLKVNESDSPKPSLLISESSEDTPPPMKGTYDPPELVERADFSTCSMAVRYSDSPRQSVHESEMSAIATPSVRPLYDTPNLAERRADLSQSSLLVLQQDSPYSSVPDNPAFLEEPFDVEPVKNVASDDVGSAIVLTAHGFKDSPPEENENQVGQTQNAQKQSAVCPTCHKRRWTSEANVNRQQELSSDPQTMKGIYKRASDQMDLLKMLSSDELNDIDYSKPATTHSTYPPPLSFTNDKRKSGSDESPCSTCQKLGLGSFLKNSSAMVEKSRLQNGLVSECYPVPQPRFSIYPFTLKLDARPQSALPWGQKSTSVRRNLDHSLANDRSSLPWCRPKSSVGEAMRSKRLERNNSLKQNEHKETPYETNINDSSMRVDAPLAVHPNDDFLKRQRTPLVTKPIIPEKKKIHKDAQGRELFPKRPDTIDSGILSVGDSLQDSLRASQNHRASAPEPFDIAMLSELKQKFPVLQRELEHSRNQITRCNGHILSLEEENDWLKHRVDEHEAEIRNKEQQMDQLRHQIHLLDQRPVCGVPCQRDRALLKEVLADFEKLNHEYQALITEYQIMERRSMEAKQEVQIECHRSHRLQMEIDRLMCEQTALREQIRMHEWRQKEMVEREALLRKALDCTSPGYDFMGSWKRPSISRRSSDKTYHSSKHGRDYDGRAKRGDSTHRKHDSPTPENKRHSSKNDSNSRYRNDSRDRMSPASHSTPVHDRRRSILDDDEEERDISPAELRKEKARLEDILYNDVPVGSSGKVRYLTPNQRADMEAQLAFIEAKLKMSRGRRN